MVFAPKGKRNTINTVVHRHPSFSYITGFDTVIGDKIRSTVIQEFHRDEDGKIIGARTHSGSEYVFDGPVNFVDYEI